MKLWFWVKFTIAAFILFGLAAYYANSQTPAKGELKACQAKYAATVGQLATAAVAIDTGDRRQAVMDLAAAVQHSYDLLAGDPAHSAEALCAPQRLGELDAVIGRLRLEGLLPDDGLKAAVQARLSVQELEDGIARFRVVFQSPHLSPNPAAGEPEVQKRATAPRSD